MNKVEAQVKVMVDLSTRLEQDVSSVLLKPTFEPILIHLTYIDILNNGNERKLSVQGTLNATNHLITSIRDIKLMPSIYEICISIAGTTGEIFSTNEVVQTIIGGSNLIQLNLQ